MHDRPQQLLPRDAPGNRWWREWEFGALIVLTCGIYFPRLAAVPVCGEESRWATAAREMIARGDWIVPRQQGTVFPERPPLGSWAMAALGLARGDVDLLAIRVPSVLATLAMTTLIFAYARSWISRVGSFAAAAFYATCGQVLALGRVGESEALFTLFAGGALLVWHGGYLRGWTPAAAWSLAYSLAALGALVKGLQSPVYLAASSIAYLALRRDWRWLFSAGHLAGVACFALIVGAWMVPFAISEAESLGDIWTLLARDRFALAGLAGHVASYPFETFACLLPWSGLLLVLARPGARRTLLADRPQAVFLLVAVLVTYPSVLLAAGARGRYYMPLYPCLAVLMGLVVEHCTRATADLADRLVWRRYQRALAAIALVAVVAFAGFNLAPGESLADARQPWSFVIAWTAAALAVGGILLWTSRAEESPRPQLAILSLGCLLGLAYTGAMITSRVQGANDLADLPARFQAASQAPVPMVSLGRIYHRFAYCYATPIEQIAWPKSMAEVPDGLEYFCFDWHPGYFDPPDSADHGRPGTTAPLPFEWDRVAQIGCDPVKRKDAHTVVVVGRVRRAQATGEPAVNRAARR
jgi:4-amino-4-deoxy-L-arabinose transferase-like glycosyltransferase